MRKARRSRSKIALALAAALTGGSVLGTCETRFKDAVISGAESYLYGTLLNPASSDSIFPDWFYDTVTGGSDEAVDEASGD
jgi:hypothetical protein